MKLFENLSCKEQKEIGDIFKYGKIAVESDKVVFMIDDEKYVSIPLSCYNGEIKRLIDIRLASQREP
jgi:prolyl-tRNA synthetase